MIKTTKILIPVDFSPCSENALEFAIRMADKINAKVEVMHVPLFESGVEESLATYSMMIRNRINEVNKQMRNFVQKVKDKLVNHLETIPNIQTSIERGNVEFVILEVAKNKQVEFIIMGTQGGKSSLDRYLGTMTSHIVKNAPCSVLVIPENADLEMRLQMGYATEFAECDPPQILKLVDMLKSFQPVVKCVHFNEKQMDKANKIEELRSYFNRSFPDLKLEFHSIPVSKRVDYMNHFIEDQEINMLVMYKPRRTFFESIFHKSYTQKMSKHVNVPLLILKQKDYKLMTA